MWKTKMTPTVGSAALWSKFLPSGIAAAGLDRFPNLARLLVFNTRLLKVLNPWIRLETDCVARIWRECHEGRFCLFKFPMSHLGTTRGRMVARTTPTPRSTKATTRQRAYLCELLSIVVPIGRVLIRLMELTRTTPTVSLRWSMGVRSNETHSSDYCTMLDVSTALDTLSMEH